MGEAEYSRKLPCIMLVVGYCSSLASCLWVVTVSLLSFKDLSLAYSLMTLWDSQASPRSK